MKSSLKALVAPFALAMAVPFILIAGEARAQSRAIEIEDSPFGLGTLGRGDGALDQDIWTGASPDNLSDLLAALPRAYAEPAYLDLARRVLLSPAAAPEGADDALAGAKLLAAAEVGFYREAGQLAELAPQLSGQPALTRVAALSALLDGDVRRACSRGARLTQGRTDPFFLRLRYLCYVDTGETSAADLTLGLLRDQGLDEGADRVFTALQTSGSLGSVVSPADAFEYAAAAMLGAAVSASAVPELPGPVLAAVVRDEGGDTDVRLPALERALSLGLIGPAEGQRLAAQMAETALAAEVVAVATERPGSPQNAEAVARSLASAPSYDGFRARAVLFREALRTSDPVLGASPDAGVLALGAIVAGEERAAERWLDALGAEPDADPELQAIISGLLALATGETRVASLPLSDPLASSELDTGRLVETALAAARGGATGSAALAALVGLGIETEGDAESIRESVVLAMLSQSGLADGVAARAALDVEAAALFARLAGGGVIQTGDPIPRVKPRTR